MIKAVIFDLGGVILNYTNDPYYSYLHKLSKRPLHQIREVVEGKLIHELESGSISLDNFEKKVSITLGIKKNEVKWYTFYVDRVTVNHEMERLVKRLKDKYTTAYISNIDKPRYVYTKKLLKTGYFDYKFASCNIKSRKPSPAIYNYALKKMKIEPGEAVFIDDKIENVRSAKRIGIHGIWFKGIKDLTVKLAQLGVIG